MATEIKTDKAESSVIGTCRYCGQTVILHDVLPEDADMAASAECQCALSAAHREYLRRRDEIISHIDEKLCETEGNLLKPAIDALHQGIISKIQVVPANDNYKASLSITADGRIRFEVKETYNYKKEV